jgi:ArsR family transcriptional regulator, arsenate/arsenite/antimonite-responsive transcriptional repressor
VTVDKTSQDQAALGSCCAATPSPFTAQPEDDERLAALCKALAHPHRVHILRFLLAQRACFAGEIAEQLPLAPSTVSQHLTQLREAGLIKGEVDGPRRCYNINPEALAELKALVAAL